MRSTTPARAQHGIHSGLGLLPPVPVGSLPVRLALPAPPRLPSVAGAALIFPLSQYQVMRGKSVTALPEIPLPGFESPTGSFFQT